MPSFDYTAIDRQGNTVKGQVQADTRDEAAISLTRTGLLVAKIEQGTGPPPPAPAAPRQSTPAAPRQSAPTPRPTANPAPRPAAAAAQTINKPASARPAPQRASAQPRPKIRTKPGRDKD